MIRQQNVCVNGRRMAYLEAGDGDPVLFLHGNPTSSYLWRRIIPHVAGGARCLAPDLLGFGASEKLPPTRPDGEDDRYAFAMHADQIAGFIEEVCPDGPLTLVVHDWGSALGFDWARRHEPRVKGIAYMESMVAHRRYRDMSLMAAAIFWSVRNSTALGRKLILERNLFVEKGLPDFVLRDLSGAEMDAYRRPFAAATEDRRPILTFQRQLPVNGHPADVHERFDRYMAWLRTTQVPKLFVNAEPGYQIAGTRRSAARAFPNQTEVTVPGRHFIQEDAPDEIGAAIAGWLATL